MVIAGLTTPSALSEVASQRFLDAQPSPPILGGDYVRRIQLGSSGSRVTLPRHH